MTTTYDRMRAAAEVLDRFGEHLGDSLKLIPDQLRADADRLEAVERALRSGPWLMCKETADRIRGEGK